MDSTLSPNFTKLNDRKRMYLRGRAEGMSRTEALRFAQYSANTRPSDVENPSVKAALARLMRQAVPLHVLVKRIAEGVSAEETKFFQKEGIVTDQRNVIAWSERREYLKLATEYGQYIETKADQDAQSKVSVGFTLYNGITTPKNRGEAPAADEAPPKIDSEGFPVDQSQRQTGRFTLVNTITRPRGGN